VNIVCIPRRQEQLPHTPRSSESAQDVVGEHPNPRRQASCFQDLLSDGARPRPLTSFEVPTCRPRQAQPPALPVPGADQTPRSPAQPARGNARVEPGDLDQQEIPLHGAFRPGELLHGVPPTPDLTVGGFEDCGQADATNDLAVETELPRPGERAVETRACAADVADRGLGGGKIDLRCNLDAGVAVGRRTGNHPLPARKGDVHPTGGELDLGQVELRLRDEALQALGPRLIRHSAETRRGIVEAPLESRHVGQVAVGEQAPQ